MTKARSFFLTRLALLITAVALPLMLLQAYTLYAAFQDAKEHAHRDAETAAFLAARHTEGTLNRASHVLRRMAIQSDLVLRNTAMCERESRDTLQLDPLYAQVVVMDENGSLVCAVSRGTPKDWSGVPSASWLATVAGAREPVLLGPLAEPEAVKGAAVLGTGMALGDRRAVILLSIDLEVLANVVAVPGLPDSLTAILTEDLRLLALPSDLRPSVSALYEELGRAVSLGRPLTVTAKDGLVRAYASAPVNGYPLRSVAAVSMAAAYATAAREAWLGGLGAFSVFVAALLMALYLSRSLSRPVLSLVDTTRRLADGDSSTRADESLPGEFALVARHLNEWTEYRAASQSKLELAQRQVNQLARFYAARSEAARAVTRQLPEDQLFNEICRICVEHGTATMAWIGLCRGPAIQPVAWGGRAREYTDLIAAHLLGSSPPGPTMTAIASGRPYICNDFEHDPRTYPWRADAAKFGVRASAAFPIRRAGEVAGVLNIYLTEVNVFDEPLVALLLELAEDVSFALDSYDRSKAQARAEQAEAANRAKTSFLSQISHELRTPLNAVLGFSQLLQMSARDRLNDTEKRQLDQVFASGAQLRALIDDVIDVSRIEAGQLAVDFQDVDAEGVVQNVLRMCEALAAEKRVTLSVTPPAERIVLHSDPVRLRQVLLNLVSNAIKYNREGGTVRVRTEATPAMATIVIEDSGLGMSKAQQAQLFQPFNRLGREHSEVGGTGIGLVLVRQLTSLLGGELALESEEGQGTCVRVTLPRGAGTPSGSPEATDSPPATPPSGEPAGLVLYIEDNPVNAALVKQLLSRWSKVQLVIAENGKLGLDKAVELRPDVILLDMQLPDLNGLDVLEALRATSDFAQTPVVVLSASAMAEEVANAKARGATDYWTKPLDFVEVLQGMHGFLLGRD